jgi:hypothetical protein
MTLPRQSARFPVRIAEERHWRSGGALVKAVTLDLGTLNQLLVVVYVRGRPGKPGFSRSAPNHSTTSRFT